MGISLSPNINTVAGQYAINLAMVVLLPLLGLVSFSWGWASVAVAVFFAMNVIGITTTFHRYVSHRAFEFKFSIVKYLFILCGTLSCSGSPAGWASTHRDHHKFSDTEDDPHQGSLGFWKLQALRYNVPPKKFRSGVRDVIADRFCLFMHKYYYLIIAAYASALFLGLGANGVYYGFFFPAALTLFSENLVNWAAHNPSFGYSTFDVGDNSRNVWWLNILSHGDGWHNNHHELDKEFSTQVKWYEFDTSGWIIRLVRG